MSSANADAFLKKSETAYQRLKNLNFAEAELEFWVFRNSTTEKLFTAEFSAVTPELQAELKKAAQLFQSEVGEHSPYGILEEPNENSALALDANETTFSSLELAVNKPAQEHTLKSFKKINSSQGYLIKLLTPETHTYFVKKVHGSWGAKNEKSFVYAMFDGTELGLATERVFYISKSFDFAILDGVAFVQKKRNFESVLKFKQYYETDFKSLVSDTDFLSVVEGHHQLETYVGSNSIQLKRMSVIKNLQHYKDQNFMQKVKELSEENPSWTITFTDDDKILITEHNVRAVVQCLLDLRLKSEFSGKYYDAPFARGV